MFSRRNCITSPGKAMSADFEIPESTCEEAGMATLRLSNRALAAQPLRLYHFELREFSGMHLRFPNRAHRCSLPARMDAQSFCDTIGPSVSKSMRTLCLRRHSLQSRTPRRGENFVTQDCARGCAVARNLSEPVLGNMKPKRLGSCRIMSGDVADAACTADIT
jgi:hypothetical protein